MNNKKFFESFKFRAFSFNKGRYTDNFTNNGLPSNYIVYLINGSAKIVSNQGTFFLKENDFFYIPKDCPYHSYWYTNEDNSLQWYSIGFDYMPLSDGGNFLMQKISVTESAKELFIKITENLTVNTENVGLFYLFLSKVTECMKKNAKAYEASIEKAVKYMRINPNSKMKDVAKFCNISEATLYTLFKKRYKMPPNEIRQKILCEKAEELLITTSLSVEEISERLGFSSSSYFRKILKKHLNATPTSIRKKTV